MVGDMPQIVERHLARVTASERASLRHRLEDDPALAKDVADVLWARAVEVANEIRWATPTGANLRGITRLADLIVEQVKETPGLSLVATLRAIRDSGGTWSKRHEKDALDQAVARRQVRTEVGPKGELLLFPVDLFRVATR